MLLIFIFSITPKKYFHDLIADHIDLSFSHSGEEPVLQDAGFNCHFENLVAESPFTITQELKFQLPSQVFLTEKFLFYKEYLSAFSPAKDNKGPPAVPAA